MVRPLPKTLDPVGGFRPKQAGVISPREFRTLLMRIDIRDKDPVLVARDTTMLWCCYASAFRAVEIAGWLVREALYPDGSLCPMTRIRASATKGSNPTVAPVVVKDQRAALNSWFDMRVQKGIMLGSPKEYRGLHPDSPVFPRYYAGRVFESLGSA